MRTFCLLLAMAPLWLAAPGMALVQDPAPSSADPASEIPAGINEEFTSPELDVGKWVERFELESREIFSARAEILRNLPLASGAQVADIGAGTGFYSRMFADAVGDSGHVFAVEISPRFLEHIARQCEQEEVPNLTPVLAAGTSCMLPADSTDLAFVCDTYHHFEHHAATLASILRALRPGGQLVVIDFERIPGQSRPWVLDHVRGDKATFRAEIESAGFEFREEVAIAGFSENYFLRFQKPEPAQSADR